MYIEEKSFCAPLSQGMDPVNERRVFDLIVRTASRPKTAQYFLLSPKVSDPHPSPFKMKLVATPYIYARLGPAKLRGFIQPCAVCVCGVGHR